MNSDTPIRMRFPWRLFFGWLLLSFLIAGGLGLLLRMGLDDPWRESGGRALSAAIGLGVLITVLCGVGILFPLFNRIARALATLPPPQNGVHVGLGDDPKALSDIPQVLGEMSEGLQEDITSMDREQHKLHAILTSMVEGLVAVDTQQRVLHLNSTASKFLLRTESEAVGRNLDDITDLEPLRDALSIATGEERPTHGEMRLRRGLKDYFIEIRASPVRDDQEQLLGAVALLHDVTDLRRLSAIRRDFVANVSHELKTPITAIRGVIETLIDDPEMQQATHDRFLQRAQTQTERLSDLVSDLLTITQLEASDGETPNMEPRNIVPHLRQSAKQMRPDAEERNIAFNVELESEEVIVRSEPEALRQIVDNLIVNAIRYTPPGGTVTLRTRRKDARVLIEVEDDGIGMEPVHLERIFQRFYRIDQARSRKLGGTGLGLSIVKHRVQSMNGDVSVRSAPGKGSCFTVSLPVTPQRETAENGRLN